MSKLTPLILAIIMLASTSLAALDLSELEQTNMIEADGRAGPDAEVVSILAPRATTTDDLTGEKLHTLQTGEDVTFEAFITNAGDTAITEMGVSVTVYLAESGARGMIARDLSGNDLSWTNGDVVCDDTFVCPWASLDAGANLDNGKYTMSYQGAPVVWTPISGDYVVVVEVTAVGDSDPANNEAPQDHLVSVVDWTDIIVDLAWDSGKEVEGGSDDKPFTLTVSTGGSTSWSARSVVLEMAVIGTLTSATGPDGGDLMGTNQVSGFGTSTMTEIFRHAEDENNVTNATRFVIDFESESTWQGVVSPDMSSTSGGYSVEVSLISYIMYGQLPDCEETVSDRSDPLNPVDRTFIHYCEVSAGSDDNAATSEDLIEGTVLTFHDIGIAGLAINQGYTVDVDGNAMDAPSMPGMTSGPLNPAWSSVQASVRHLGSDLGVTYDWEVTFDIENTVTGVIHTEVADSCAFGFGEPYNHMMLGDDPMNPGTAFESGEACIMFEFAPGVYTITATASMTNIPQSDSVNDDYSDMSSSNDDASIDEIYALNIRPEVDLTLDTLGDIIIGPEGIIELTADAYDFDDPSGLSLHYIWTHPGMFEGENGSVIPSHCNGVGPLFSTCLLIPLDSSWAGTNTYSVIVSDAYGSPAQDFLNIEVWNHVIALDDSESGIEMIYDLTYRGSNAFGITIGDSTADAYTQDLTLFGYAGEYTSVAVLDYEPSAVYMAQDVHAQSMTINYDALTLEPTSVFWVSSNGHWAKLDSTISFAGDDGTIAIDLGQDGQVLPQGTIALMGGELLIIDAPSGNPADLLVEATAGGQITATWSYAGTTVPGFDWLLLTICDSNDVCDVTKENTTLVAHSLSGQTDTTHGLTYTYTLAVCNGGGCNPTLAGPESATADKMVDGDAVAGEMSVFADENSWIVSWVVDGTDSSDVTGWKVCWDGESWATSGGMPTTCVDAGDWEDGLFSRESVEINHPGGSGMKQYYFTAVPYDDKGNMDNAEPGTDIMLEHATQVDPCVLDPNGADCSDISKDDTSAGEVPTWTWGVIIGLVVIAFVVGAFILSRGGEGKDDKDWDY
jgi:hypothetical protein